MITLNVEAEKDNPERRNREWTVILNAKLRTDISECQMEKDDSECRKWEDMTALNTQTEKRLWL